MRVTKKLAQQYAATVKGLAWDDARERLDIATGGELDCIQLDLLTDWTVAEAAKETV